jgi:prepilin-type processing-associated H-X9-DG protein
MMSRSKLQGAFTLVELLAVVSILVLLVSLLLPFLAGARELARRVKCQDQYRQIGQALLGFSADHMQRGPGSAYVFNSTDRSQWITQTEYIKASEGWKGMLESEFFRTAPDQPSKFPIWLPMYYTLPPGTDPRYSSDLQTRKKQFACPSARVSPQNYCLREMCVYVDFDGGPRGGLDSDLVSGIEGPCGHRVDPPPAPWMVYMLGPRYDLYPNPGGQFALWESEWATDDTWWVYNANGPTTDLTVNDVGQYGKPYTGLYGQYAFRHYNLSAVFLFFDGHVEVLRPQDRIMGPDRYKYKLN